MYIKYIHINICIHIYIKIHIYIWSIKRTIHIYVFFFFISHSFKLTPPGWKCHFVRIHAVIINNQQTLLEEGIQSHKAVLIEISSTWKHCNSGTSPGQRMFESFKGAPCLVAHVVFLTTPGMADTILPLLFCLALPTPCLSRVYSRARRELPGRAARQPASTGELEFIPRLGAQQSFLDPGLLLRVRFRTDTRLLHRNITKYIQFW